MTTNGEEDSAKWLYVRRSVGGFFGERVLCCRCLLKGKQKEKKVQSGTFFPKFFLKILCHSKIPAPNSTALGFWSLAAFVSLSSKPERLLAVVSSGLHGLLESHGLKKYLTNVGDHSFFLPTQFFLLFFVFVWCFFFLWIFGDHRFSFVAGERNLPEEAKSLGSSGENCR